VVTARDTGSQHGSHSENSHFHDLSIRTGGNDLPVAAQYAFEVEAIMGALA
jgi:hypothetical protein